MRRSARNLLCLTLLLPIAVLAGATPRTPIPAPDTPQFCSTVEVGTGTTAQKCCKVCTKGKACGDSCIARDKVCHKGAGCACNG
jgi:hypothetical protein